MLNNPIVAGTKLPALSNPGTAGDLLTGKQLIDGSGNVVTGTFEAIPAEYATIYITNLAETASGNTQTLYAQYAGTDDAAGAVNTYFRRIGIDSGATVAIYPIVGTVVSVMGNGYPNIAIIKTVSSSNDNIAQGTVALTIRADISINQRGTATITLTYSNPRNYQGIPAAEYQPAQSEGRISEKASAIPCGS